MVCVDTGRTAPHKIIMQGFFNYNNCRFSWQWWIFLFKTTLSCNHFSGCSQYLGKLWNIGVTAGSETLIFLKLFVDGIAAQTDFWICWNNDTTMVLDWVMPTYVWILLLIILLFVIIIIISRCTIASSACTTSRCSGSCSEFCFLSYLFIILNSSLLHPFDHEHGDWAFHRVYSRLLVGHVTMDTSSLCVQKNNKLLFFLLGRGALLRYLFRLLVFKSEECPIDFQTSPWICPTYESGMRWYNRVVKTDKPIAINLFGRGLIEDDRQGGLQKAEIVQLLKWIKEYTWVGYGRLR